MIRTPISWFILYLYIFYACTTLFMGILLQDIVHTYSVMALTGSTIPS